MNDYSINIIKDTSYTIELNEQGPQGIQGERGIQGPEGPIGHKGDKGDKGEKGDTGVSVVGVEEISKVDLVATYRMTFSNGEYFDYEVTDGSLDILTRETIISIIGYEPASYTSVEGLTTRVSTLEERVEDLTASKFPNVVIIGTPHVEGGQVSGFSNTNYLQFPFVDISRGLPFDIYFSFTTGSDVVTQQNILDSHFGIALAIQNSKGVIALSSNGTSWDIGNVTGTNTILPNTTYYAKCSWTGTQYNTSLSTNNTTYITDMVLNSTLTTNKTTIFIGGSSDLFGEGTAHPFKGTINFNNSRVDVQGTTVWEGMADVGLASRANVSLNNLDEVGESRFNAKQDALTAGNGITIENNVISAQFGSGLEICDIGMALYVDETKGLRRYLNGQIVDINTNTQAFLNRLQQITTLHPSLLCTEEEWQTAKTMSAFGQVGKFVFNYSGEDIVSVRIPRVVNIQGVFDLQKLGMTVAESLPNITGKFNSAYNSDNMSGAFGWQGDMPSQSITGSNYTGGMNFNASRSSSTYQDGAPVQQEAIQYPYFIQIATGAETQNNIVNDIELNNPYVFGKSEYSKTPKDNLSWLASKGQWNPKGSYPSYYDWILENVNKGEEGFKLSTATDITDYDFVINTADETFRLPLLDGSEDLISDNYNSSSFSATNGGYVLPINKNGQISIGTYGSVNSDVTVLKNNKVVGTFNLQSSIYRQGTITTQVVKGDEIKVITGASGVTATCNYLFFEAKGNGSLYYYVGETVQKANLIDAGRIGEQLANKQDKCIHITETYKNGTSGYRIWSDGYCEQWGVNNSGSINGWQTVTFLKTFKDTNYIPQVIEVNSSYRSINVDGTHNNYMRYECISIVGNKIRWKATGYLAQ